MRQKLKAEMKPRGKTAALKKKAAKAKAKARAKSKATAKAKAKAKSKAAAKAKAKAKSSRGCGRGGRGRGGSGRGRGTSKKKPTTPSKRKSSTGSTTRRGKTPKARTPPVDEDGNTLALGCSSCRYTESGCDTCENPNFKGKRRDQVSAETIRKAQQSLSHKKNKLEEPAETCEDYEEMGEEEEMEDDQET